MDEFERSWQRDCGRLLVHRAHLVPYPKRSSELSSLVHAPWTPPRIPDYLARFGTSEEIVKFKVWMSIICPIRFKC